MPRVVKIIAHERKKADFAYRAHCMYQRCQALQPRWRAISPLRTRSSQVLLASFDIFASLPSVEPHWVPEDAETPTDEQWDAALPAILKEFDLAKRALKVQAARRLVAMLAAAGAPVNAELADKLKAPAAPIKQTSVLGRSSPLVTPSTFQWTSVLRGTVDIGDTADAVTDAEFESVFSQLVAKFCDRRPCFESSHYYPEIYYRNRVCDADVSWPWYPLPAGVAKQVLDVARRAGLPNHQSSEAKLEDLGLIFRCHGCTKIRPLPEWYLLRKGASLESTDETLLPWSRMVRRRLACFHSSPGRVLTVYLPVLGFAVEPCCRRALGCRLEERHAARDPPRDLDLRARPSPTCAGRRVIRLSLSHPCRPALLLSPRPSPSLRSANPPVSVGLAAAYPAFTSSALVPRLFVLRLLRPV